jgi:serine phosphatase RsbU (regulator of sigma subunit)/PAS domain-containing protein
VSAVRSALAGPAWSRWGWYGVVTVIVLTVVDAALAQITILVAALVLVPLVCAVFGRRGDTLVVWLLTVALAAVSGSWNSGFGRIWVVAFIVVAVGGALAVVVSLLRAASDVTLSRFRLLEAIGDVANGARSLDATVAGVLEVLVPRLADAAALDGDGRRLAARGDALAAELDAGRLDAQSTMRIPLRARGREVGRLSIALSERRYSPGDRTFAQVLAGRIALALDNAGLTRQLSAAARQLDAVLEGLAEAVTVMDSQGRTTFANDAAVELLKAPSAQALYEAAPGETMTRFAVYDEAGAPVDLRALPGFRALAGNPDPEPLLVRNVVRATGEERWLLNKTTTITDESGEIVQVVNVIENVTDVKRAEIAQRLLARAGEALGSSLDYDVTLQRVAEVAVPVLADWCGVDVPGDGVAMSLGVAHADPERLAIARQLRSAYPVPLDEPDGIGSVILGGSSVVVSDIPDAAVVAYARDEEHLRLLRTVGFGSYMVVPLRAGGETLGALTLVRSDPIRKFSSADLELAEELGRRAGTALLNARLATERAAIAQTLQRGLRPPDLPEMPGWRAATLYRPAGELNEVGGDFYDAFPTRDGWMVLLGDVAGQGAEAATLTGLARYTLRTAGQLSGDPALAADQLNATLRAQPELSLCTALCVHLTRGADGTAQATLVSCGHPLPILARGGTVTRVGKAGTMAGAFDDEHWESAVVDLRPADTLVLFTDGVIDTVGERDRFGEERLLDAVRAAPVEPAELVAHVAATLERFQRGRQRDDTAVVAVQLAGAPVTA